MLFKYYNGTGYGYFETDILDLFENCSINQTKMFFKTILRQCENSCELASEIAGNVIDKLSELETLADIMTADNAKKTSIGRINRRINRLKRAKELCMKEV